MSQPLTVISGRYRLESLIGEGGMASIWRAHDLTLARPVAVKLLFARDDRDHEALVARFLREARIAAAVQHRNVIHIVDFGTTPTGQPFMVMELLQGESLGDRVARQKSLPLPEVVHITSMTLRGLCAVHEAGIIHRDLKPDNIYLKVEGGVVFPKILDFGISRSVEPASGRRSALTTKEGIIVGTPEYMSPEQARGVKTIDRRTDIYSMGVIMYQALTGKLPFESENVGDLIIKIVTGSAPKIRELAPDVPEPISEVVDRAMARDPAERFNDANEMQAALTAAAELVGDAIRRSLSDLPPPTLSVPTTPRPPRDQRLMSQEFPLDTADSITTSFGSDTDTTSYTPPGSPSKAVASPFGSTGGLTAELEQGLGLNKRRVPARWHFIALIVGVIAVGTAIIWSHDEPAPVEHVTSVAISPASAATQHADHVTVQLRNVPGSASVNVDGSAMTGPTFDLPKDGRARTILVNAEGKLPWQAVFTALDDQTYDVMLQDSAPAAADSIKPVAPIKKPKRSVGVRHDKSLGALRNPDF